MEEGLKIQIGADVTELIAGLSKASAALKAFGSTGTAGAKEIEKAIKQLSKSTKGLSGEELERVNTLIAKLRDLSVQLGTKAAVSVNILGGSLQDLSADAATVTPQIEKLSTAIANIPEGSFAVSLDADVASYLPKIEGASEALKQLGQTGIIAGNQAEAALLELGKAAQQAGTADLVKLNAAISAIGSASEKFKTTGVQAFDSFGASVQQAASKVAIVGPAISNAVKEVEVIKSTGFTIKINADTQEAIQGLRFVSKETKALGVTGEASIGQVEKAIIDLNKQLKNGGGGAAEVQRLNTALAGLKSASANFNVDSSVKNLGVLEDKAKDVKAAVTDLSGVNVTTTFNVQGTEASKSQVDSLGASIDQVRAESDVEILLNVQAQQAISNLNITSDALERLGTTGKGSIAEVNIAIAQLQQAARNASGVELAGITLALKSIGESSSALGINAANGFGLLENSATDALGTLNNIPPAVQRIQDSLGTVDGAIAITPSIDERPALADLDKIIIKADDVKESVEEIGTVHPVISVSTSGVEESQDNVEALYDRLQRLIQTGDYKLDVSVDAKKAVHEIGDLNDSLRRLANGGVASVHDVEDAMIFLANAAKKPGAEIEKIELAMKHLTSISNQFKNAGKAGFDVVGQRLKEAGNNAAQLTPKIRAAGSALTDVGRIAQDAPFSILSGNLIAVSNNIDPLINSFRLLRAEAGSTSGAMKALGSSLLGGGGIALAVSVIVGAITLFSARASQAKAEAKGLADETAELTRGLGEEASKVAVLVTALKSDALSRKEKKEALDQLKKANPEYFGQLKEEEGLIKGLTGAYANYLAGLSKSFQTRALKKQLDELFDKKVKLEAEVDPTVGKLGPGELKKIDKLQKQLEAIGNPEIDFNKPLDQLTDVEKQAIKIREAIRNVKPADVFDFTDTKGQLADVDKQINGLLLRLGTMADFDLDLNGGNKESNNTLRDRISILSDLRKSVGLTAEAEQELLNLLLVDKTQELKKAGIAGEALAKSLEKVKFDFTVEGIDLAIQKMQKLNELLSATRSRRESIFELKLKKIQLENPDLTTQELKIIRLNLQQELDLNPLMIQLEYDYPKIDTSKIKKPDIKDIINPTTGKNREDEKSEAEKEEERLKKLADTISQDITPVFTSLFDVIGKDGASALETLGDSLKQLLKQLAAAAAQAAIFAAIMTAISPAGSATKALGFGGNFLKALGLGAANLGNQNRRFVQGNAANLGRDELYTQLRGRDIDIMIRRNNTSNSRFS